MFTCQCYHAELSRDEIRANRHADQLAFFKELLVLANLVFLE